MIIKAVLDLPNVLEEPPVEGTYVQQIRSILKTFVDLVKNYIRSDDSQRECLQAMEQYCLLAPKRAGRASEFTPTTLTVLVKWLYDEDVLSEESILAWFLKPNTLPHLLLEEVEVAHEEQLKLRKQPPLIKLVNWLKEAEEESSDD